MLQGMPVLLWNCREITRENADATILPFLLIAAHAWPAAFPASRPEIPPHRFPVTPEWYHGAPLGNGDLGVIVYGQPGEILYTIGKNDVWDRRYSPKPEPKQVATIQVRLLKPDDADGASAEHELDLERAALLTTTRRSMRNAMPRKRAALSCCRSGT